VPTASLEQQREPAATETGSGDDADYVDELDLKFTLKFRTSCEIAPIEDWLQQHQPGRHALTIEGFSDDFIDRDVQVLFASSDQRNRFKAFLRDYVRG